MMRRKLIKTIIIIATIFVSLIIISVFATAIIDHIGSDLHGELEWKQDPESDESLLQYHGNDYCSTDVWLRTDLTENDVQVGWSYGFPFSDFYYYTDGTENPLYILSGNGDKTGSTRNVYIRNDYDFKKQTFIIEGTDIEFVFEEAFIKTETDVSPEDYLLGVDVIFSLKDEPRLKIYQDLYQSGDNWYFIKDGECWFLSDELIYLLKDKSIL